VLRESEKSYFFFALFFVARFFAFFFVARFFLAMRPPW
jgi:hypothetical protein